MKIQTLGKLPYYLPQNLYVKNIMKNNKKKHNVVMLTRELTT